MASGRALRLLSRFGRPHPQYRSITSTTFLLARRYSSEATHQVKITETCSKRLKELKDQKNEDLRLRVRVDSGGCSGFQYEFILEPKSLELEEGDLAIEQNGAQLVVDEASLEFLNGSTIDYEQELIGSKFVVSENPNSESACGCGVSFSPKM
eukprot:1315207-Amorphochlora_amoeboformis.AAC.2